MYYTLDIDDGEYGEADESVPDDSYEYHYEGSGKKHSKRSRPRNATSARELKNLLADVKPVRRWANAPLKGQQELYEALELVLEGLRNLGEHSFPFLSRVRKSEAPDYYDIIKEPMDLGTMQKKLRKQECVNVVVSCL